MKKYMLPLFAVALTVLFVSCEDEVTLPSEFPPSNFKVSYIGYYDGSGTSSSNYYKVFTWDDDSSADYYNLYRSYGSSSSSSSSTYKYVYEIKTEIENNYYFETSYSYSQNDPDSTFYLESYKNGAATFCSTAGAISEDSSYWSKLSYDSATGKISWTEFPNADSVSETSGYGRYLFIRRPYTSSSSSSSTSYRAVIKYADVSKSSSSSNSSITLSDYSPVITYDNYVINGSSTTTSDTTLEIKDSYSYAVYVICYAFGGNLSNGVYYARMTPWTKGSSLQ